MSSKWRENFEGSNSVQILKDAIRDAKDDKYKDKIDKALSGTVAGKYKRRGKK